MCKIILTKRFEVILNEFCVFINFTNYVGCMQRLRKWVLLN